MLSALRTGRLQPQKIFVFFISLRGCVDPRDIVPLSQIPPSGIETSIPMMRMIMTMMMMMMMMMMMILVMMTMQMKKKKMSLLVD